MQINPVDFKLLFVKNENVLSASRLFRLASSSMRHNENQQTISEHVTSFKATEPIQRERESAQHESKSVPAVCSLMKINLKRWVDLIELQKATTTTTINQSTQLLSLKIHRVSQEENKQFVSPLKDKIERANTFFTCRQLLFSH